MASARSNIESIYRLSPVQEGILYHCLESTVPGVYQVQYSCIYHGVDPSVLLRAWQMVVERHTALRTLFTWKRRDKPLQIVRAEVSLPWYEEDWRDADSEEQARKWRSLLQRDRDRGFNLEQAPLMRCMLVRLSDDRYRFLWSFHHLILDGASMRIIADEVSQIYSFLIRGEQPSLAPARQFEQFIAWCDERDESGDEAYWRRSLSGIDAPTPFILPGEGGPRRVAVTSRRLPAETVSALTEQGRRERVTLNTFVVAAWSRLLGVYARADEVVVGTTVSGRTPHLPGVEKIAGMFINTLPLRVALAPDTALREWLQDIQREQLSLRDHEHSSLVAIRRLSDVPPGVALFEAIIVFENMPSRDDTRARDPAIYPHEEEYEEISNYPFALLVVPGESLELRAVHDPARYSTRATARLLEELETILERLSRCVDGSIAELDVLPAWEHQQVISELNNTRVDVGEACCIQALIEPHAQLRPDAIAAVDAQRTISYAQLDDEAGHLAAVLRAQGIGENVPVPVLVERSVDAVVAIVAILKAGGAYVPLDPQWPLERIGHVIEDLTAAGPLPVVVSTRDLCDRLGANSGLALCIDEPLPAADTSDPHSRGSPQQLAYVIYTSGSTGTPKGVMVSHANLHNSTLVRDSFYAKPPKVFLLLSPLSTDSSIAGLFWTLCTGGTLLLPRRRIEQDLDGLGELMTRHGATHVLCLPSLYAALLDSGDAHRFASLNTVIVAGEACTAAVIDRHRESLPDAALYNEYGPSEATVWATATRLDDADTTRPIPIGAPVGNTTAYVLDPQLRPVPLVAPGELCIGGANVALGYLNQSARTAERFVQSPFGPANARLYRSGDLVRRREDGVLEFLGRVDNQVKVRGFRVELEEIETALATHPAISDVAVALVGGDTKGTVSGTRTIDLPQTLASLDPEQADTLIAEVESMSAAEVDAHLANMRQSSTEQQ